MNLATPSAILLALTFAAQAGVIPKKLQKAPPEPSLLDKYVASATASEQKTPGEAAPGAIWSPTARLNDLARDPRASQRDDVVTVIVTENINAAASGASTTAAPPPPTVRSPRWPESSRPPEVWSISSARPAIRPSTAPAQPPGPPP